MIQPGLERIALLLKGVEFPWKTIHVAGTNGKGSICSFASALLTRRQIRNGRFVSPHLINRWDGITINDTPVSEDEFRKVEDHFIQLNKREGINASEFELLTATAFELFNANNVEVGVVEVGMGGKLDATNILNNQTISVISMIARDHQNFLGHTLEDIAHHKAGILRPDIPYIINPMNEWNVKAVIEQYAKEIGAGPQILADTPVLRTELYGSKLWHKFADDLQPFQRDNGVLAYLAFVRALEALGHNTAKASRLLPHMKQKFLPGRLQTIKCSPVYGPDSTRKVLIDGAHNENAAGILGDYVRKELRTVKKERIRSDRERGQQPITWVLAMTEGKDVRAYLRKLLRPGDNVVTTVFGAVAGMPWIKPMDPRELLRLALETEENITGVYIPTPGTFRALCAAKYLQWHTHSTIPIVLTGSLYLVGDFARDMKAFKEDQGYVDLKTIDKEERFRINTLLSHTTEGQAPVGSESVPDAETDSNAAMRKRQLEDEIEKLNQEMLLLEQEESRLARAGLSDSDQFSGAARVPIPGFDGEDELIERDEGPAERNKAPATESEVVSEREEAPAVRAETSANGKLSYRYLRGNDNQTLMDQVESIRNRLQDSSTTPKPQQPPFETDFSDNDSRAPQYPKRTLSTQQLSSTAKIRTHVSAPRQENGDDTYSPIRKYAPRQENGDDTYSPIRKYIPQSAQQLSSTSKIPTHVSAPRQDYDDDTYRIRNHIARISWTGREDLSRDAASRQSFEPRPSFASRPPLIFRTSPRPFRIVTHVTDPRGARPSHGIRERTREPEDGAARASYRSQSSAKPFDRRRERTREPEYEVAGPSYRTQGTKRAIKKASKKRSYKGYSQRRGGGRGGR